MLQATKSPGRPGVYPWETWFTYDRFTLLQGKHYRCRSYVMAQQVRNAASRLRRSVSITIHDDEGGLTVEMR